MKMFRYQLEPYKGMKTRFCCPKCGKKNVFTKYVDTESNAYLNELVGCCNRMLKCGYHYKPREYFQDNNISSAISFKSKGIGDKKSKLKTSFIAIDIMQKSMSGKNYFIDYLASLWDMETANFLKEKYNIGTSKYWSGATVFWQLDKERRVRSGKIMLYNPKSGKREKKPFNHINWVHSVLKLKDFNLDQCYFGEHLLVEDKNKPVAIVESEKTAVISSIYLPEFIWLACGSVNNLNASKTKCLKGRSVILFPDLKCYDIWNDKIPTFTNLATFRTSTLLRDYATEKEKDMGLDLADYLIKIKP
ncbi:DUF6371 domain-containing protein [Formosa algae]|uniref:Rubredoxin n=1 Tax=Formosa algae TaxID=225843 RepID=A0A9X0YJ25_9FLAO|nr:DUF6371 domain-containing protein [Formosa algae]MBP1839411.1 rubredoxin [Formosa algae]MDQ0334715.1 rubredoxin [Formosa algae]OEI81258.1 hypothetical protein AST99_04635 [Formosa algae]